MESTAAIRKRKQGSPIPLAILCCLPLAAVSLITMFGHPPLSDFITYWSAGRLFDLRQNPYSMAQTLVLERGLGWSREFTLVMLCPPWTLPVVALAGLFPFREAQAGWFWIALLLNGGSAVALWRYFGGAWRSAWIALVIALTFTPLAGAQFLGQITPLMLASLTAFLLLMRAESWFWAGVSLLGLVLKPQLLWLVLLAVLLWALREKKVSLLLGGLVAAAAATAGALWFDPLASHYFHDAYGAAMATDCGLGGALRLMFGHDRRWLQYVPCVAGVAWFGWYWVRHRRTWSWREDLPLLLIVSVASSPYCWLHDFILILPAWIALGVRGVYRSVPVMAGWLIVQGVVLIPGNSAASAALSALWIPLWLYARAETERMEKSRAAGVTAATPADVPA
jgi:hypothetical protein